MGTLYTQVEADLAWVKVVRKSLEPATTPSRRRKSKPCSPA